MEQRNEKKEEYIFSFEKLEVWQSAVDLADVTLDLMESFPANRCYRIVGQMETAVSRVAQHIAEGKGRQQKKEFINCLYSAKGSVCEVLTLTRILTRRGLVKAQEEMKIKRQAEIVERKLYGLINFLRGKADN
jgi:four helix bundle protein